MTIYLIELEDDTNTYCINLKNIEYFWSYFNREILDNWYCISIRFKSNMNGIQLKFKDEHERDIIYNKLKTKFNEFINQSEK